MHRTLFILALMGCCGLARAQVATLVPTASTWSFHDGTAEPTAADPGAWRQPDYDPTAWPPVQLPVFFGEPLAGTDLTAMRGAYTCAFLRREFLIDAVNDVSRLRLGAVCDGGFVAWINGQEIARYNVRAGEPAVAWTAASEPAEPVPFQRYDVDLFPGLLWPGTNVLAVQVFSSSLTEDEDLVFDAQLEAELDQAPPKIAARIPPAGSQVRELAYVEVQFDELVLGVDAADLLMNGVPATNVVEVAPGDFLFAFVPPSAGVVVLSWAAATGITDASAARHPYAGDSWVYVLDPNPVTHPLMITEFMADNKKTLNDTDGDSSDWIEIYNPEETAVDLQGWALTDSRVDLRRWAFPSIEVAAGGYLLVFASGKDRRDPLAPLHTNFKLNSQGGYLALVDPAGVIVSDFAPAYPAQYTDIAYGRAPGDAAAVGYLTKPTPRALNAASGPGFAPEVQFSARSLTFAEPFALTLSTPLAGAVIRYTLDGTLPTNSSRVYLEPIPITNSVQVRARAYAPGLLPGMPHSEAYLMLATNVVGFRSDLPVLLLHCLGKGTPSASRPTFAQAIALEPTDGITALTNAPKLAVRSAVQVRGSSTEGYPKLSLKVELRDEFEQDIHRPLLGLPSESDWVLYAPNNFESVLIHNPFVHQLSREMGRYSPRTRFVEVYLNRTTGPISQSHYMGIYVLEEKIKVGPNRVDIDELEPEHVRPPEVTGGYLLKIDRLDPGDSGLSAGGATMAYVDPKEREIKLTQRRPQQTYLKDYFTAFGKALSSTNWRDPVVGYRAYVDVGAWIDFHVLEVLSGNVDSLVLSTYFHKPRNGKIVFGPHWDFDRALGSTDGRDANPRLWSTGPFFSAVWWSRLFADKDFWQLWVDRWQELRETHFALTNIHGLIDRLANEVRQAQPREYQKWRVALRGGSYQSEVNLMKNWLSNRIDFIDRQLTQPPTLGHPGGVVTRGYQLTLGGPPNATLYYTLDGTDPRASQGDLSAKARAYTAPIAIDGNARVVVRARDLTKKQTGGPPAASSTPWSRPVSATYVVSTPALVLTELMFHPAPAPTGSSFEADDFEFVELMNGGSTPLDLVGFQLTEDIQYQFTADSRVTQLAPGERVVVVRNEAAFVSRYPGPIPIAGEFAGSLPNGHGRLALQGPFLEPIWRVEYRDDWAPLADGFGFSLVPVDESDDLTRIGDRQHWRLSQGPQGSPGQPDPVPPRILPVWVNEVLANPAPAGLDAVELFNPNAQPVDISGWYLTDDYRAPAKYRFPTGSVIAPWGYHVVSESEFGRGSARFALKAGGDEIFLFSADGIGALTGWVDGFPFGASGTGCTLGRWVASSGATGLREELVATLGGPNAGRRVGPLIISEIMPENPTAGSATALSAYVELHNPTGAAVPLSDPDRPERVWRLRGAVDFDCPTGTVVPPGGHVVIVAFNPQQSLGDLAFFRTFYHAPASLVALGPWSGQLMESAPAVRLLRPDAASANAEVTYLTVDEVTVPSTRPAGQPGASLGRRFATLAGEEPVNWAWCTPSPGATDTDGDGLPDEWEWQEGLDAYSARGENGAGGDPDRDGIDNWGEYTAQTDAWIGPTTLTLDRAILRGGDAVLIRFVGRTGRRYSLETRATDARSTWQILPGYESALGNQPTVWSVPVGSSGELFRVRVD